MRLSKKRETPIDCVTLMHHKDPCLRCVHTGAIRADVPQTVPDFGIKRALSRCPAKFGLGRRFFFLRINIRHF
jgi:hypothetical protein